MGVRSQNFVTLCSEQCCGKWRPWQPGPRQKENVLQGRKWRGQQDSPSPEAWAQGKARQPQVPSPQVMHAVGPLAPASLQQRGKGEVRREAQRLLLSVPPPSQLLQTAVHLPFALFPGPGPALGAELLQVFFEVLVVHGPVAGGLTVRLHTGEDEMRGPCLTRGSRLPPSGLARLGPSRRRAGPQTLDETAMTPRQIGLSNLGERGAVLSRDFSLPGISGRTPCTRPSGHTARGSAAWGTRYQADLALSHTGTYQGAGGPKQGELFQ